MGTLDKNNDYQTPPEIAEYMTSLIPRNAKYFLEPSSGSGNLVDAILKHGQKYIGEIPCIEVPENFFLLDERLRFDCILMNPPYSDKQAYGIPADLDLKGMKVGYYFLDECMKRSDHVIALMPVFTIIDSDVRKRKLKAFGLKSITSLPRKTFKYTRIQTCILELDRSWWGNTTFRFF
jgi:type I restriction-modification system DNA methylase subunit